MHTESITHSLNKCGSQERGSWSAVRMDYNTENNDQLQNVVLHNLQTATCMTPCMPTDSNTQS